MTARLTIRQLFTELIPGLLVLLFLYTAITKLKDPTGFVGAMQHNPVLVNYALFLRWLIPILEIGIVILLFIPTYRRSGLLSGAILMACFSGYVGYMLLISSDLPCTCGGIIENMTWPQHFWVNIILTVTSFTSWFFYPKRFVAMKRRSRTPANHSRQQLTN